MRRCPSRRKEQLSQLKPDSANNLTDDNKILSLGCLERFCYGKFNLIVRKAAPYIAIAVLAWLGVATYFAVQMQPLSAQENWLPSHNPRQRAIDIQNSRFPKSPDDELITVTLFWGVQGLDKSRVGSWDEIYYGDIIWDTSFTLSSPAA